jgi:hypothetical protein
MTLRRGAAFFNTDFGPKMIVINLGADICPAFRPAR